MDVTFIACVARRLAVWIASAAVLTVALVGAQSAFAATAHHATAHHAQVHHAKAHHAKAHHVRHARRRHARKHTPARVGSTASVPCVNTELIPTSANIPQVSAATLCLINQQRALHGESPLRENADLDSSATHHSEDMVAANYYDHTSPTGETLLDRIQASGYLPSADAYELGENIDLGVLSNATPAAIVADWMASPGHRANILDSDFVDSGIGIVPEIPAEYASGEAAATYTQEFGVLQAPNGSIS